MDEVMTLFDPDETDTRKPWQGGSAAAMNRTDSDTGRVMRHMPDGSVDAAMTVNVRGHRQRAYTALLEHEDGLTSREIAVLLPLDRDGNPQNSNRASGRLGELWEERRAAVLREHGMCMLGVCHAHDKPRIVHKPQEPCERHGRPVRRDNAAIWVALEETPRA
jgi:hypothetical protein